jgi:hypothetical protein
VSDHAPGPDSADGTLPPATTAWATGFVAFASSPVLALGGVVCAIVSIAFGTLGAAGRVAPGTATPVALVAGVLATVAFFAIGRVEPHSDPEDRPEGPRAAALPVGLPAAPGLPADALVPFWKQRFGFATVEAEGIRIRWMEYHHGLNHIALLMMWLGNLAGSEAWHIVRFAVSFGCMTLALVLYSRRHERFVPWDALAEATAVGPRIQIVPRRDAAVLLDAPPRTRAALLAALTERVEVRDYPGRAAAGAGRTPPRPPFPPRTPSRDAADPRTGRDLDRALEGLRRG